MNDNASIFQALSVNPDFVGREAELRRMQELLESPGAQHLQVCVIQGLGGLGKTQLANEYAHKKRRFYRHVFWVHADTITNLTEGFGKIAKTLRTRESNYEKSQNNNVDDALRCLSDSSK